MLVDAGCAPFEAFMAAVERMGLDADIVHSAQVDESKEGVAECIVFSFEFRATKNKRRINIKEN